MKGWAALLLAVGLAAACATAGPASTVTSTAPGSTAPAAVPTATRPVDVPSGSCIFTLDVDNETVAPVSIAVNSASLGAIPAGVTKRFYEMMDGNPPLPWSVRITRTADGAPLVSRDFPEGTLSGSITVRDAPVAIAAGYCP
jgi:hypothetical protein